jgi:hypothetical protein
VVVAEEATLALQAQVVLSASTVVVRLLISIVAVVAQAHVVEGGARVVRVVLQSKAVGASMSMLSAVQLRLFMTDSMGSSSELRVMLFFFRCWESSDARRKGLHENRLMLEREVSAI